MKAIDGRGSVFWAGLLIGALTVAFSPIAAAQAPTQCPDEIELIGDAGCSSSCCSQEPPGSGNFFFTHSRVEEIDIRNNSAAVASVSFPNLQAVEGLARISFNQSDAISGIYFPMLKRAGIVEIISNPGLVEIDLPMLSAVEHDGFSAAVKVRSNPQLSVLNLPVLQRIFASEAGNAFLEVRFNPLLEEIDFPLLRSIEAAEDFAEAYIFIQSNDSVRSIRMDDLRHLTAGEQSISYLILDEHPQVDELSFSQLTELLPTGGPYDFSELTIGHSPKLVDFVFPSLERVSVLQLSSLKGTERAMFPRLAELGYLWIFRSCLNAESSLSLYICSDEEPIMDNLFNNDDGLCGSSGYRLHSSNVDDEAACDASNVCQSFEPQLTECKCGAVGLCKS